jgi:hypothetical protein
VDPVTTDTALLWLLTMYFDILYITWISANSCQHHENMPACADRSNDETPSRSTVDKPFKCGVCGKRYTSLNALDYVCNPFLNFLHLLIVAAAS